MSKQMTVAELREKLKEFPDDALVFVQGFWDDFYRGPLTEIVTGKFRAPAGYQKEFDEEEGDGPAINLFGGEFR